MTEFKVGDRVRVASSFSGGRSAELRGMTGRVDKVLDESEHRWPVFVRLANPRADYIGFAPDELELIHRESDVVVDDSVNNPKHYMNHPCGLEIIEIVKHHNYPVGNALKYLFRHPFKGNPIQDLEKAVAYIQFEIARVKAGGKLDRT